MKRPRAPIVLRSLAAFLSLILIVCVCFPKQLRTAREHARSWIAQRLYDTSYYHGEAMLVVDLQTNTILSAKDADRALLPASLAKLFVIQHALRFVELHETMIPSPQALALMKPGSSRADLQSQPYPIHEIFAAMLVPSGNDAAYALANYVGAKIRPTATSVDARISAFMESLNTALKREGYASTHLRDPSGYDPNAQTSASDLHRVCTQLLAHKWFRAIVRQSSYQVTLANGMHQHWTNTNQALNPRSSFYNPDITGLKTGSLSSQFNLITLYEPQGHAYLLISLGSQTDTERYLDTQFLLNTLNPA